MKVCEKKNEVYPGPNWERLLCPEAQDFLKFLRENDFKEDLKAAENYCRKNPKASLGDLAGPGEVSERAFWRYFANEVINKTAFLERGDLFKS